MKQTTPEEFRALAASGDNRLIPVWREILADIRTPLEALRILKAVSDHCFLLESAEANRTWGRFTYLGYDPRMELSCADGRITVREYGETRMETGHPAEVIRRIVRENRAPRVTALPCFTGGLVGYFSYEYLRYSEPTLTFRAPNEHGFHDVDLMFFDKVIAYDHLMQKIILIANVPADDPEAAYRRGVERLDEMERLLKNGKPLEEPAGHLLAPLKAGFTGEEYCDRVRRAKEHIVEGDIFQLVLSNPMEAPYEGSLLGAYRILRTTNPSPYMFYFSGDTELAGASPETLVKVENGVVRTFPLAGSRPRGNTEAEDLALERELLSDEKELAEHNMLVDLGRNDLGRVCRFGSVQVERYMEIERYSHIMHIGSEVKGLLREDMDAIDALGSVLPAGTLSGAPKLRACEIIDALEGDRRGIYGGAIGYVDLSGNLDTCIAIRLAYKKDGCVFVRSGAGIVADSVPEREHAECGNKAKAVVLALEEGATL